jgi:hypothetical protein
MNTEEAIQHALGYAAGREDASSVRTVHPDPANKGTGFFQFADAYAAGWTAYNSQTRFYMTSCRDAYDTWQATSGRTIFKDDCPDCRVSPAHHH